MSNKVDKLFSSPDRMPRAEIWISGPVLEDQGLTDDLAGHMAFRAALGMDVLFLPVAIERDRDPLQGYRYFRPEEAADAAGTTDWITCAVIDGPFQRALGFHGPGGHDDRLDAGA